VTRIRKEWKTGRGIALTTGAAAGDVLNRWTTNAAYLTVQGDPMSLPFESKGVCFARLVREAAGDIPPGAIKFELARAGCIIETDAGDLKIIRRHYVPSDIDSRLIDGIHYGLRTMAGTVEFNANESDPSKLRFQRVIHRGRVAHSDIPDIRGSLSKYLTTASHAVDDYLSKYHPGSKDSESRLRVGVGLYYYEEMGDE
jgi:hypothetical protein